MKVNGKNQGNMKSYEIKVGSKVVMTHSQRQAFLKKSSLGKLLGVSHLLPEVEQETNTRKIIVITKKITSLYLFKRKGSRPSSLIYRHLHPNPNLKYTVKASSRG